MSSLPAHADDWNSVVRACVERHDLACAQRAVDGRLAQAPNDLEALTWRARLLGWSGQWPQAEAQYQAVLTASPANADALLGLADVQYWSHQFDDALTTLDLAARAHAPAPDVLSRRGRVLAALHRNREAMQVYGELRSMNPSDTSAEEAMKRLRADTSRQMLRIGSQTDTFSFTGTANQETISLESRWNERWSSMVATNMYQRFGQTAEGGAGSLTYHVRRTDWFTAGGSVANHQDVVAQYALALEYGHGWGSFNRLVRGLELNVRHQEMWFTTSRVATFGGTEVTYLPHDLALTVGAAAVRTRFSNAQVAWAPAGFARLGFPIVRRLEGNILYGVGAETFPTADQTGKFSAHTYGGGVKLRPTAMQEITCSVAAQERTQGRSQFSVGVGYGIRF